MSIIIECAAACILFTLAILPSLYKNPVSHIMSYPAAIRERVEQLEEYADVIKKTEKRQIAAKVASVFVIAAVFAPLAIFAGDITFSKAFLHVFTVVFVVNIYDLVVLDIVVFCHSKKLVIPGTEDMIKEYRSPVHHIKGAVIGTGISIVIALLAAGFTVAAHALFF